MEHINEIDIIEYTAGNLDHDRNISVERHLGKCPACAKRCAEISELWDLTGNWNPTAPVGDIAQKVLQQVRSKQVLSRKSTVFTFRKKLLFPLIRVAATLVIAAGTGHVLGLRSADRYSQISDSKPKVPIYLAALGLQLSNDLTWSVLAEDQTAEYGDKP